MKLLKKFSVIVFVFAFVFGLSGSAVRAAGPLGVNLGAAGNFAVLAKSGISTTGSTLVTGDIGVSPAQATYITGFGLSLPASSAFATSSLVNGKVYAPGYANPTSANMTASVSAMETAYTDAAGRTNPTATELGAGNIGGMTLAPGLYKWGTGVTIPTDVTLSGGANDVWIFQIAQNLNISSATNVILSGGAQAGNVFWIVGGQATIGTAATFNGNILSQTAIVLNTGAQLNGRALAQTAVTLDSNFVNIPSSSGSSSGSTSSTGGGQLSGTSTTTGSTASTTSTSTTTTTTTSSTSAQVFCPPGQMFSTATGQRCTATSIVLPSPASLFGQQVRAIATGLATGSRGINVTTLQQFLISQNKGPSAQALANVGATAYFGGMTRAALAEFQAKVGISPALGNFGPITRAYLKANY